MNCIHLFTVFPEIFPVSLMTKPLNTQNEWIILTLIKAVAGFSLVSLDVMQKYKKQKPWINQVCKEFHTATLGMKLTSMVRKSEIKINLSKSKVKLHQYSKSISTTKCVISPLFKISMHLQMWNRAPTPTPYAPPSRTWTMGIQHVKWVCRPLPHQSLTLSSQRSRR